MPGRIGALGYSLGGFLTLMMASEEPLVRAVTLAAAGDLPDTTPYAALVRPRGGPAARGAEARRPAAPARERPARHDDAPRAGRAAVRVRREPKELRWYDGGHWPPPSAIAGTARGMDGAGGDPSAYPELRRGKAS
jgi:dienelactone hydrolase